MSNAQRSQHYVAAGHTELAHELLYVPVFQEKHPRTERRVFGGRPNRDGKAIVPHIRAVRHIDGIIIGAYDSRDTSVSHRVLFQSKSVRESPFQRLWESSESMGIPVASGNPQKPSLRSHHLCHFP